jgi:hypothetical protein
MRPLTRLLLTAALLLSRASSLHAQTGVDPSAHWEGAIQAPNMEVKVEIDLSRNSAGKLAGTFSSQRLKGFPLADVAVDGRSVRLLLKANSGGGTFEGMLSVDGKWLSGDFITAEGGFSVPFSLTRNGDARIAPPARSAGPVMPTEYVGASTSNKVQAMQTTPRAMRNAPQIHAM